MSRLKVEVDDILLPDGKYIPLSQESIYEEDQRGFEKLKAAREEDLLRIRYGRIPGTGGVGFGGLENGFYRYPSGLGNPFGSGI